MTTERPVRIVQSEMWLDRAEFADLVRQREPETVPALRCPDAGRRSIEVRPLVVKPSRTSGVAPLFSPVAPVVEVGQDEVIRLDDLEPAAAQASSPPPPARSFPRWAAAGVLVLLVAGGAVSVPLLMSHGDAAPAPARNYAPVGPVVAFPAPDSGDQPSEPADAVAQAPAAEPNPPAHVTVKAAPAGSHVSHAARTDSRATARPPHAASPMAPPPWDGQAFADEAYMWSQAAAAYSARNPRWTHVGPEPSPWP